MNFTWSVYRWHGVRLKCIGTFDTEAEARAFLEKMRAMSPKKTFTVCENNDRANNLLLMRTWQEGIWDEWQRERRAAWSRFARGYQQAMSREDIAECVQVATRDGKPVNDVIAARAGLFADTMMREFDNRFGHK